MVGHDTYAECRNEIILRIILISFERDATNIISYWKRAKRKREKTQMHTYIMEERKTSHKVPKNNEKRKRKFPFAFFVLFYFISFILVMCCNLIKQKVNSFHNIVVVMVATFFFSQLLFSFCCSLLARQMISTFATIHTTKKRKYKWHLLLLLVFHFVFVVGLFPIITKYYRKWSKTKTKIILCLVNIRQI